MGFTVGIDMQPLCTEFSKNRGIGFYNHHLFHNLLSVDKNTDYILLNHTDEFCFTGLPNVRNHRVDFEINNLDLEGNSRNETPKNLVQNYIKNFDVNLFHFTSPFDLIDIFDHDWYKDIITVSTAYDLIPLIYKNHYLRDNQAMKNYMKRIELIKKVNGIIAISQSTRNDLANLLNISPKKIEIIYPGVDPDFQPIEKKVEDEVYLNKKYGINCNYIVCTGGMDFRKNIFGLIASFSYLPDKVKKNYKLVIICRVTPNDVNSFQQFGKLLNISDQLIFTNYVPKQDLIMLYNYASLSVFPSFYEGFGLPVLEAMSCGTPVVCSNNSSLPEIVGGAGILINPHSSKDIAEGINNILTNLTLKEELTQRGLERSKNFEWEKAGRLLGEYYSTFENEIEIGESQVVNNYVKMKIAFFSSMRPQSSGISDYSEELLTVLNKYFDIDIIIDDTYTPVNKFILSTYNIVHVKDFNPHNYKEFIYQMGNNEFHTYMLPVMKKNPGITVLHDANLHGLFFSLGVENNDIYNEILSRTSINPEAMLLQRIVNHSKGILVHSHYTAEKLSALYSNIPVLRIPMGIPDNIIKTNPLTIRKKYNCGDCVIISAFGIVAHTKRIVELIVSYTHALKHFNSNTKLFIVGKNALDSPSQSFIDDLIEANNLQERIIFHGEVPAEEYNELLSISDLVVSLRYPQKGETSAALMRAIAAGKPTIATDIGTFSEIPDEMCLKISYGVNEIPELVKALVKLVDDPGLRIKMGHKAFEYFDRNHRLEHVAIKYKEAILRLVSKS
ncbi:glycosyltransferase [Priestia aryabhattai]|uniref:glycosyltransferase n=1 Tax=Priestia TaxID=2800373 RepID=UPI001C8E65BC|nr:glycosyltransferase [Priestia aryabhattai]MBY0074707.1 glycosyltransferase [Priestia aryabhattai]